MSAPILFMGEQSDPELDVLLSRGITRVYSARPSTRPPRIGCPIAGCHDTQAEDTLCEPHMLEWESSTERKACMRHEMSWEEATRAFGKRLGTKEETR